MDIDLSAQLKASSGKGACRRLRLENRVPAVLYGPKTEPISLSVSSRRLEKLLRDMGEESKLLRLTLEGVADNPTRQVLIRDIQTHPVRRQFLHVDFYEVPLDQPIVVEVPVELKGEAVGVRKGGTLNPIQRTVSVKCLPGEIPEKVPVDISNLDLGDTIHVADLIGSVPFELVGDKRLAIVNVAAPEGAKESPEGEE